MLFCLLNGVSFGEIDPNGAAPLKLKLQVYFQELHLAHATKKTKNEIIALTDIAKSYLSEKQYDKTLLYLLKAKDLNRLDKPEWSFYNTVYGQLFSELGAYSGAIEYQKRILIDSKISLERYYSASEIGALYLKINEVDSSLFYYNKQLQIAQQMNDYIAIASAQNNLGIAYIQSSSYSKAKLEFEKALQTMQFNEHKKSNNFDSEKKVFYYNVTENLGRCYHLLGDYKQSIAFFELSFKHIHTYDLDNNKEYLLKNYLATGNTTKANAFIQQLAAKRVKGSIEKELIWQKLNLLFALHTGNIGQTRIRLDAISECNKQLKADQNLQSNRMSKLVAVYLMNETKANIRRERLEKHIALKRLHIEEQQKFIYLIIIIAGLLFVLISGVLIRQYLLNKKRAFELRNEQLIFRSKIQASKIKTQENYMTEFALDFTKNRAYDQTIIKNLQQIIDLKDSDISSQLRSLVAELKQKQVIDKRAEELAEESENVLKGFKLKLLEKHPSLNKSDIQLCNLIKLDLSNKEIASIKNVSPDSIKIFKNRLKHKLQLSANDSLTAYLKSI